MIAAIHVHKFYFLIIYKMLILVEFCYVVICRHRYKLAKRLPVNSLSKLTYSVLSVPLYLTEVRYKPKKFSSVMNVASPVQCAIVHLSS